VSSHARGRLQCPETDDGSVERAVPQVEVPSRYRGPTNGRSRIDVDGRTVRECIEAVEAQYPGFSELVFDAQGGLRRFVRLFVNGDELARDALDTPIADGDRVEILAAMAGG
jgi:molybdopterin synthase sulfur carrier subunit